MFSIITIIIIVIIIIIIIIIVKFSVGDEYTERNKKTKDWKKS